MKKKSLEKFWRREKNTTFQRLIPYKTSLKHFPEKHSLILILCDLEKNSELTNDLHSLVTAYVWWAKSILSSRSHKSSPCTGTSDTRSRWNYIFSGSWWQTADLCTWNHTRLPIQETTMLKITDWLSTIKPVLVVKIKIMKWLGCDNQGKPRLDRKTSKVDVNPETLSPIKHSNWVYQW